MRIVHLDTGREMRGGQWQVLRLLEGLRAAGHDVTLLARAGAPLAEAVRQASLDVRPLKLSTLVSLASDADIVHTHDGRSHTLAAGLAAKHLVVSRRVAFPLQRNPASHWKYKRAAHYIAVSEFVKRVLEAGGVPASKISVVYDGVPLQPLRSAGGDRIVILDLADAGKGTALALEAARLAGAPVLLSRNLENDLSQAAAFMYLTLSEGLGSAVLLAMAAGVPVIVSNIGGLPEIVEHERTGLVTENSAAEVAGAIKRLRDNPELAHSLAKHAREQVEQKFTVEQMVARTIAVYEKIS